MTDDETFRMTDDLDVVVRRSPRYGAFLVAGLFLGFIVAGILALLPVDTSVLTSDYSMGSSMALLMILLGLVGLALGGCVALILDRVNAKKARTYTVRAEYTARSRAGRSAQTPPAQPSTNGNEPDAPAASPGSTPADGDAETTPDVED